MSDNVQRQSAALESVDDDREQSGEEAGVTTGAGVPSSEETEASETSEVAEKPEDAEDAKDHQAEDPPAENAAQGDSSMAAEAPAAPPGRGGKAAKAGRKAHLTLSRVEPWSVMKFSFVVSLVCFIILFVAVAVIYTILSTLGVFDAVTELIASLTEGDDGGDEVSLNPASWFSPTRVLGYTALIGALNIILITALATVGAMLYNLAADLVGGLDVTLSETE